MFALNSTAYFQRKLSHKSHTSRLRNVKAFVDTSKPKARLKCTKQPLSEFNLIINRQIEDKHLLKRLTNPLSVVQNKIHKHRLIKNSRKDYYEQHERRIQNEGLLKRLKSAKTSYSVKKQLSERVENQQYLKNLCKFGFGKHRNPNFRYNLNMLDKQLETQQTKLRNSLSQVNDLSRQRWGTARSPHSMRKSVKSKSKSRILSKRKSLQTEDEVQNQNTNCVKASIRGIYFREG